MRNEIIKKRSEELERRDEESRRIPLHLPEPEIRDLDEEEVSVISHVIVIDLA